MSPLPSTNDDLTLTERIRATPEQVFDFLVEPDKLLRWMGTEARIDPVPGGDFWLNVNGRDVASGSYVSVDRPNQVVFTWGWEGSEHVPPGTTEVTFNLSVDGEETVVELIHTGLPGGQSDEHGKGWTYFLGRLTRAATGETLGPPELGS